jgi:hypothetical protein
MCTLQQRVSGKTLACKTFVAATKGSLVARNSGTSARKPPPLACKPHTLARSSHPCSGTIGVRFTYCREKVSLALIFPDVEGIRALVNWLIDEPLAMAVAP